MKAIDVIKTELACVQRDCCRVENQCAKCDLVLPVEEIISAYEKCITVLSEYEELKKENTDLKKALKGKKCNCMIYLNFKDLEKELTKSKKYIRELLDFIKAKENGDGRTPTPYFYEEYEKFLKEIEK